jgi:uncharacterized protein (TIGR03032 family)
MKLGTEFIRLPLRYSAERLAEEVSSFAESEWKRHPQGFAGNSAISLIAVHGDPDDDAVKGPMLATPHLDRCPYLRQVLASFGTVLGRTRLMRIAGNGDATPHVDISYYWLQRVRIHVPVITFPEVEFLCGDKSVHMAAGECWLFDTWRTHNVINPTPRARIHLVADSVGSPAFWDIVNHGARPFGSAINGQSPPRFVPFDPSAKVQVPTEAVNFPVVMSPEEQDSLLASLYDDLRESEAAPSADVARLRNVLESFQKSWKAVWARAGVDASAWPEYRQAIDGLQSALKPLEAKLRLPNGVDAVEALRHAIIRPAVNPELAQTKAKTTKDTKRSEPAVREATRVTNGSQSRFDRPVFIVAAPRSGSSFLFETLARSPGLFTVGGESHREIESIESLRPAQRGFESNRLTESDASEQVAAALQQAFNSNLRDRDGRRPPEGAAVRMLEKTPKNALRIPFLASIFPDARFIYLFRDPRGNLSSILDAWKSQRFITYRNLPDWNGPPWSLLLIPEWQKLRGAPLAEIAAQQYISAHRYMMSDLSNLSPERWCAATYEDLVRDPQLEMDRLCRFAGIAWDQAVGAGELPLSRHTLTPPDPEKWRKNADELAPVLPRVDAFAAEVRAFIKPRLYSTGPQPTSAPPAQTPSHPVEKSTSMIAPAPATSAASASEAKQGGSPELRCVNTPTFPALLNQLGISLVVSTYQAGKLILLRADGDKLNLHFRNFQTPMGMACHRRRLAVGGKMHVWEFENQPEVGRKMEPAGKHDACYLPRQVHTTGDIRIHEMAFVGRELWIVNTRFSCLCTLDGRHSFVPRWRPSFVTALAPEDRCHLNGLAIVDGKPRYVTALGQTDVKEGWRENKAKGGCLLDVESGAVLLDGLSMPHSPRVYGGAMWVLESGEGSLARVNLEAGRLNTVTRLPGFTRGLDFAGHYAFVGLSKVRETAVFSGIPITERLQDRTCGVWVIDLRTGKTAGFLRFESGVEEVFAVQVLPGIRYPELVMDDPSLLANSFMIPEQAMADVPAEVAG